MLDENIFLLRQKNFIDCSVELLLEQKRTIQRETKRKRRLNQSASAKKRSAEKKRERIRKARENRTESAQKRSAEKKIELMRKRRLNRTESAQKR